MTNEDYETGRRDGKIEEIERLQMGQNERFSLHERRFESIERRVAVQEKVTFMILGAVALIELAPIVKELL